MKYKVAVKTTTKKNKILHSYCKGLRFSFFWDFFIVIVSGCLQFPQTISLFGFIHSNLYGNKIKITYSKNSYEISMSFRKQKKQKKIVK